MSEIDAVRDFVQAWNDKNWDAIEAAFTEDVVYHNIPMDPLSGKAAAMAAIRGMQPDSVNWQILNIAQNGNVVLTERLDDFVLPGGKPLSMPVMGVMEFENGKIRAWRDYFDLATFTAQMTA